MSLNDILKRVDEQIKAKDAQPSGDRRVQDVPVAQDRRKADRRGEPRRDDFASNEAYNKAYDRWSENQQR